MQQKYRTFSHPQSPTIKIIIGNGFDVHCGAKSTYLDFFNFREDYKTIINELNALYTNCKSGRYKFNAPISNIDKIKDSFGKYNIWDLFFCLKIYEKAKLNIIDNNIKYKYWCDVEVEMSNSFKKSNEKSFWKMVYNALKNHDDNPQDDTSLSEQNFYSFFYFIFAIVIKEKSNIYTSQNNAEKTFYIFLLNELKQFENNFSHYINKQLENNDQFIKNCANSIKKLSNNKFIHSIDSFNFHRNLGEKFNNKLTNINGYDEYCIFGIDDNLEFDVNDPEYIFTKSFRKTSNLIESEKNYVNTEPFDNVIIYGHSLNKSDFGYFFSIFDLLDLQDTKSTKKLVFAYSLYREDKELQKLEFELAVHNILKSYCVDRKINERLIETLLSTDRIIFYEIPVI